MEENNYRILVVDDEQDLCEILKFNLETEGYAVDTANSAEEAMNMELTSYNLLLLDVMMGTMSGFAMAKKLKEEPATAHIPIIFLTARDTENDTVTGFNLGADDYISKPFSIREVLVRIRAVIRRTAETENHEQPKVLKYQGLEMNLDKKRFLLMARMFLLLKQNLSYCISYSQKKNTSFHVKSLLTASGRKMCWYSTEL